VVATEFALILPVLLLIVVACIDFGRVMYSSIALQNAARAGAAYAAMNNYTGSTLGIWKANVEQAARDEFVQQFGLSGGSVGVTVPTPTVEAGGLRRVRVTVTYNSFQLFTPLPGLPNNLTLSGSAETRLIR